MKILKVISKWFVGYQQLKGMKVISNWFVGSASYQQLNRVIIRWEIESLNFVTKKEDMERCWWWRSERGDLGERERERDENSAWRRRRIGDVDDMERLNLRNVGMEIYRGTEKITDKSLEKKLFSSLISFNICSKIIYVVRYNSSVLYYYLITL